MHRFLRLLFFLLLGTLLEALWALVGLLLACLRESLEELLQVGLYLSVWWEA